MRHTIQFDGYTYAYGIDHVLGVFFEKYKDIPPGKTIQEFDISEFVAYIPHPDMPLTQKRGVGMILPEIIKTIEWEMENNGFPMNLEHLELLKQGKNGIHR